MTDITTHLEAAKAALMQRKLNQALDAIVDAIESLAPQKATVDTVATTSNAIANQATTLESTAALDSEVSALQVRVAHAEALIAQETTARVSADIALGDQIQMLAHRLTILEAAGYSATIASDEANAGAEAAAEAKPSKTKAKKADKPESAE